MCSMSYTIKMCHMLSGSNHTVWLHHFSDAEIDLGSSDAGLKLPLKRSLTFQIVVPLEVTKYCCSNFIIPFTFVSWELRE